MDFGKVKRDINIALDTAMMLKKPNLSGHFTHRFGRL